MLRPKSIWLTDDLVLLRAFSISVVSEAEAGINSRLECFLNMSSTRDTLGAVY